MEILIEMFGKYLCVQYWQYLYLSSNTRTKSINTKYKCCLNKGNLPTTTMTHEKYICVARRGLQLGQAQDKLELDCA